MDTAFAILRPLGQPGNQRAGRARRRTQGDVVQGAGCLRAGRSPTRHPYQARLRRRDFPLFRRRLVNEIVDLGDCEPRQAQGCVGIDLGREAAPDETTIYKFRHLIEDKGLSPMMLTAFNDHLKAKGIKVGTGTIIDATLISAPSSTKCEG